MVEDVIETFESGNKKVYVRYYPGPDILEKHYYNAEGLQKFDDNDRWFDILYFNDGVKIYQVKYEERNMLLD